MDDNDTEVFFFVEIRQSLSVLLKMTIYMHFASQVPVFVIAPSSLARSQSQSQLQSQLQSQRRGFMLLR